MANIFIDLKLLTVFAKRFPSNMLDRVLIHLWEKNEKNKIRQSLTFVRDSGVKSSFIILLKTSWLNPSPFRLQLTFVVLFSTYDLTTSIVSAFLAVLLLLHLPLMLFFLVRIFLCFSMVSYLLGGSFSRNIPRKASFTSR